jgi:hypothetical protein
MSLGFGLGLEYSKLSGGGSVNFFTNEVLGLSLGDVGYGANIEVDLRRSSNDDVQTFTPSEIIDGTLITFCGSGSGFVNAWRDITNNIA